MMSGSRSCAGSLTRWVTLLVLIQCCLVLIYITFTQTSSSSFSLLPSTSPIHVSDTREHTRDLRSRREPSGEALRHQASELTHAKLPAAPQHLAQGTLISKSLHGSPDAPEQRMGQTTVRQHSITDGKLHHVPDSMSDTNNKLWDPGTPLNRKVDTSANSVSDNGVAKVKDSFQKKPTQNPPQFVLEKNGARFVANSDKRDEEALSRMHRAAGKMDVRRSDAGELLQLSPINRFAGCNDVTNLTTFPEFMWVPDETSEYFLPGRSGEECLKEGTLQVFNSTGHGRPNTHCLCRRGWHGQRCSIPDSIVFSEAGQYVSSFRIRSNPRRIISAIAFNVEFELLEARLQELGDAVDVYILHESNYTNYGKAKPLRLLERLREGYLMKYQHKILYLYRGDFPSEGRLNGWIVDQSQRTFISEHSLKHLKNLRSDDIFIYTDADEIPSRDALLFLKVHDGYPEPIGFSLRWSVFGFYWKQPESTRIMAACSVNMLRNVFQGDIFKVRSQSYETEETNSSLMESFFQAGGVFRDWFMAEDGGFAGWHCSWCLSPEGVQIKLTSAINADFPRWGDFPEKLNLSYIRKLIVTGTWFDDQTTFMLVSPENDPYFAPRYAFQAYSRFRHLLDEDFYTEEN